MPQQRRYDAEVRYHSDPVGQVTISAAIPLDIRSRLENEAERSGQSLSGVIRAALNSYTLGNRVTQTTPQVKRPTVGGPQHKQSMP
jgi:Ribbon-helix-helix protein, copG family.